ncbi:MAG: universal stress protein [Deltaproteobacteria bacterium]|nr:universal stress protein [Deltaproteobacteria bacterium]
MEDVKRILVVSRSTSDCRKAVHYGLRLSKTLGAEMLLAYVDDDILNNVGADLAISKKELDEENRELQQEIKRELDALIASEQEAGTPVRVSENFINDRLFDGIMGFVEKENIDLLILMAHPEGRIERTLFDPDYDKLIHELPCSIFLVKEDI